MNVAYKSYKPIGVATTGNSYFQAAVNNNLAGVVFAENNPNFAKDFVTAIGKQRFWDWGKGLKLLNASFIKSPLVFR